MVRNPTSTWTPRRHKGILKWKPYEDAEGTITGFTSGRETAKGSRLLGKIGALIVDYEGKRLELSGLKDEEREFETAEMAAWARKNPGVDMPSYFGGKHFKVPDRDVQVPRTVRRRHPQRSPLLEKARRGMNEQEDNLDRVKNAIGDQVEAFIKDRWASGKLMFFIKELHDYIAARLEIAPASPQRILQQLRLEGKINYVVLDRRASKYQVVPGTYTRPVRATVATATLLHRGKPVVNFPANGKRFRLPAHVIEHLHPSNDFELEIAT